MKLHFGASLKLHTFPSRGRPQARGVEPQPREKSGVHLPSRGRKHRPERGDESIVLNGEHLTKGVPAKILRSVLAAYTREGRTVFEYRDFKRDFDISLGQKNSNFEIRFYRLMEKLAERVLE
jgi:hypothetical protein